MNLMLNRITKFQPLRAPADAATGDAPPADDTPPVDDTLPVDDVTPDYSFLPEAYNGDDGPDLDGFKTHYDELVSAQAIAAEGQENVPEDAAGYEFAMPEDIDFGELDLPEGFKVELAADDPMMAPLFEELGSMLHGWGVPKDGTNAVMGMLAKYEAAKHSQHFSAAKAEMTTLGTAAKSRIANIQRTLEARLPADGVAAISAATTTAAGVKALEKLLAPRSLKTPTPEPQHVDTENMTAAQRLDHANGVSA